MDLALLAELNGERAARRAVAVLTNVADGASRLVREAAAAHDPQAVEIVPRFRSGKSGMLEDGTTFCAVQMPPVRVIAIGAVHISQALAPMARGLDLDVTVVDPRTAFATVERFPAIRLLAEWPDEALPKLGGLDRYTALLCLTHDPKIDDPALVAGLRADCFYIGALGSRRTHAKRMERLAAAGFGEADAARIHAPIGLAIGAVSPAEIAVSILAEMVSVLRGGRAHAA